MPPMIGGPHYLSSSPIFGHKDKVGWGTFIFPVPRQDDFRNFCMSEETEKVYENLKELTGLLS